MRNIVKANSATNKEGKNSDEDSILQKLLLNL
jgi:hypothetical protein